MCSRYSFNLTTMDLRFLGINDDFCPSPVRHIAPGQQVWLVRLNAHNAPELARAKWGLVPPWLTDFSRAQINARVETAATSSMFAEAWQSRRCLLLADSYYQWYMTPDNRRQLWRIKARDRALLLMAGLWERYPVDQSLSFDSCAVLTMPSLAPLRLIAQRMPVVLTPQQAVSWLSGAAIGADDFVAALAGFAFHSQQIVSG